MTRKEKVVAIVRKHLEAMAAELAEYPIVVVEDVEVDFEDKRVCSNVVFYGPTGLQPKWTERMSGSLDKSGRIIWKG